MALNRAKAAKRETLLRSMAWIAPAYCANLFMLKAFRHIPCKKKPRIVIVDSVKSHMEFSLVVVDADKSICRWRHLRIPFNFAFI